MVDFNISFIFWGMYAIICLFLFVYLRQRANNYVGNTSGGNSNGNKQILISGHLLARNWLGNNGHSFWVIPRNRHRKARPYFVWETDKMWNFSPQCLITSYLFAFYHKIKIYWFLLEILNSKHCPYNKLISQVNCSGFKTQRGKSLPNLSLNFLFFQLRKKFLWSR